MATKKIPMRMCVGCREMHPKKELVRIVRPNEGELHIDKIGKAPGRGAYICPKSECLDRAIKTKAIERALEKKVDAELYEKLRADMVEDAQ